MIYPTMSENDENKNDKSEDENKKEEKSVSIKGVRKDLYKRINALAKEMGQTIGEVTNDAYRLLSSTMDGAVNISKNFVEGARNSNLQIIANIDELTLKGEEIKEFSRKVSFRNIKVLTLTDIDDQTVESKIHGFVDIDELRIPKELKKSIILPKCSFVSKIVQV